MIALLPTIFETAFILSIAASGVWLTSKVLHYDDLAVEASFCWGGALTARFLSDGMSPLTSTFFSLLGGAALGLLISLLYTRMHLTPIMTGIITTTALFSCNLWMGGANKTLGNTLTFFDLFPLSNSPYKILIVLGILAIIVIGIIRWLLTTEIGLLLRAVGENSLIITHIGKSPSFYQSLHLIISHSLIAFAGSLFVQYTGFFSLWSSVGILVATLASSLLAHLIAPGFGLQLILGTFLYQSIITLSLSANVPPEWNKLLSASILLILMLIQRKNEAK